MRSDYLSALELADLLDNGNGPRPTDWAVYQLINSGFLGADQITDNDQVHGPHKIKAVNKTDAERLASFQPVGDIHPDALIIRAKVARKRSKKERKKDLDKRTYIGWRAELPERFDGVRQWHSVKDCESWIGHLLVVTIAGFVVEVFRIKDYQKFVSLVSFEIERVSLDDEEARHFIDHRFPDNGSGPTVRPLECSPGWPTSRIAELKKQRQRDKEKKRRKSEKKRKQRNSAPRPVRMGKKA